MKRNEKGFTLVELLAVIAILAIIVVIAYPLITNVIQNSRKSTLVTSALNVVHAAELAYADGTISADATSSCLSGGDFTVDASKDPWGNAVTVCSVTLDANGTISSISFGTDTTDSGSYYISGKSPSVLDASADITDTTIFSAAPTT